MGRPRAPSPMDVRQTDDVPSPGDLPASDDVPSSGDVPASSTHLSSSQLDDATLDVPSTRLPTPPSMSEGEAHAILSASVDADDGESTIPVVRPKRRPGFDRSRVWDLYVEGGKTKSLQRSRPVANWITDITHKQLDNNAWEFQQASQASKDRWFNAWKSHFNWDENQPGMDINTIHLLWEEKAQDRYNDSLSKARTGGHKPEWLETETWERWKVVWSSADFQAICDRQKKNRAANPHLHTSGSRPHSYIHKDMTKELGQKPTPLEFYSRTHKRKVDGEFVDSCSREIDVVAESRLPILQSSSSSSCSCPAPSLYSPEKAG